MCIRTCSSTYNADAHGQGVLAPSNARASGDRDTKASVERGVGASAATPARREGDKARGDKDTENKTKAEGDERRSQDAEGMLPGDRGVNMKREGSQGLKMEATDGQKAHTVGGDIATVHRHSGGTDSGSLQATAESCSRSSVYSEEIEVICERRQGLGCRLVCIACFACVELHHAQLMRRSDVCTSLACKHIPAMRFSSAYM